MSGDPNPVQIMIGGYIYRSRPGALDERLRQRLPSSCRIIPVWNNGFLFFTSPFGSRQKSIAASENLFCLSEDLLCSQEGPVSYRHLDIELDFHDRFRSHGVEAFQAIQNDFRMAVVAKAGENCLLYLASNRAGSGRIYYHKSDSGIVFCSDLRFLLTVVPLDVNRLAIYSILKYGSIPEPLTISRNASAVPAGHYLKYDSAEGRDSTHPYFRYHFLSAAGSKPSNDEAALGPARDALKRSAELLSRLPSAILLSGGIDSSLYGCYMHQAGHEPPQGFYCAFGADDPEFPYAEEIARRLGVSLQVATMGQADAVGAVEDAVRLTDHPFSDFSSLPIAFLLRFIKDRVNSQAAVIECNGGDDCFGFPALTQEGKFRAKHMVPGSVKKRIARAFRQSTYWKWESSEGTLARVASLADVHEPTPLTYFLVLAPVNYLALDVPPEWDRTLHDLIEKSARRCTQDDVALGYEAKTTIRQLLFVNSARWAAKALSVGESLGLRVVYPYIWRDILEEQGKLPWSAKVHNGTIKWPLKKLLEEFMPGDFIYRKKSGFVPPFVRWLSDPEFNAHVRQALLRNNGFVAELLPPRVINELLNDALHGNRLRSPILNMLWGAIFTESWIQAHKQSI